ncbi:MAG TPA: DegQ family serine endoprotease [Candidatus Acidoferrales bacterium]|nr:DegQ family serine endoprotease [Candidatus Acidoferrales bacterium]
MSRLATLIGLIIAVCIGVAVGSWATVTAGHPPFLTASAHPVLLASASSPVGNLISFQNGFVPVVKKDLPAVVNIASSKIVRPAGGGQNLPFFSDPFFRDFFGNGFSQQFRVPREQREHSLGSGVIIAADGYILTNNHVVDGASDIKVSLYDKRELKGTIVGTDPKTDLAVVRVSATNLPVIAMADSSKLQVGEFCIAIGDPFGVGETVTMGIVSATGRGGLGIEDYEDFIQTDAAINPGNSGGALVNVNGDLIGVNTAIVSGGSGGNQGVGFAIPASMARQVTEQILKHGKVVRGSLGVIIEPVTAELARAFGLTGQPRGALISQVQPDSGASRAGLQRGDIILQLNGEPVIDSRTISLKISTMAPGTNVTLRIFRNGQEKDVTATLGELQTAAGNSGQPAGGNESGGPRLGIGIEPLTPDIASQLHLPANTGGVVVTDVQSGSAAEEAGLRQGDVIQEVNRKPVRNTNDFQQAMRQGGNQPVLLLIQRGSDHVFVVVEPR